MVLVFLLVATPPASAWAVTAAQQEDDAEAILRRAQSDLRAARYDDALRGAERAAELFAEDQDRLGEVGALITAGDILRESGAAERAIVVLARAERRLGHRTEEEPVQRMRARLHRQRAQARAQTGEVDRAFEELEEATRLLLALGDRLEAASVDATRAVIASWSARHRDAVDYGERAFSILDGSELEGPAIGALSAVAYGLQELGELERALEAYERLIPRAWLRGDQRLLTFAYCNRAALRWTMGEAKSSEEDLRRVVAELEDASRRAPVTPEERAAFLEPRVSAYERLIRLLVDTYRGDEAFTIAELFRGRALSELMDLNGRPELGAVRSRSEEQRLLAELGRARLAFDLGDSKARERLDGLSARLDRLRSEALAAEGVTPVSGGRPAIDTARLRAELGEGEALVAYWLLEDRVVAWAFEPKRRHFVQVPVSRRELEEATRELLAALGDSQRHHSALLRHREDEFIEAAGKLHRWLIESLPRSVRSAAHLVIVADDVLHHLPFEALLQSCDREAVVGRDLLFAAYRGCRFLGWEKAISLTPSASVWLDLRAGRGARRAQRSGNALALAPATDALGEPDAVRDAVRDGDALDRLPALRESRAEAEALASHDHRATVLIGAEASENRFRETAPEAALVHLASHGLVHDDLPMTSGVLLRPGGGDDGLLQTYEILSMSLRADLVMISACRSGRGRLLRGEGLLGLGHAFLAAGVGAVGLSRWQVDDQASRILFEAFYRELARGKTIAESLRAARTELATREAARLSVFRRREISFAHPRYWAAFTLLGDARDVRIPGR